MKSLEAALEIFSDTTIEEIRAKSMSLTGLFIDLFDEHLAPRGFALESPRAADSRGSHVALGLAGGKSLVQQMSTNGVIADFRPPDLMRFGMAPLYNSYADVVKLVEHLATP
jgi:kynureninase